MLERLFECNSLLVYAWEFEMLLNLIKLYWGSGCGGLFRSARLCGDR
jgi:hypothetical protein